MQLCSVDQVAFHNLLFVVATIIQLFKNKNVKMKNDNDAMTITVIQYHQ